MWDKGRPLRTWAYRISWPGGMFVTGMCIWFSMTTGAARPLSSHSSSEMVSAAISLVSHMPEGTVRGHNRLRLFNHQILLEKVLEARRQTLV